VQEDEVAAALREAEVAFARACEAIAGIREGVHAATGEDESGRHPAWDPDAWQEASAEVGQHLADARAAMSSVNELLGLGSARHRLLRYLRRHLGEAVPGAALAGVGAIYEWPRRIRELRVEEGWPIESGAQRPDLDPDAYILTSEQPDQDLASRWRLASQVRGFGTSAKVRLLTYLQGIHPQAANQDELSYVAKINAWQRRMRELDEEGWDIRSNVDEPNLKPGTYRLATLTQRPPRARQAIRLRHEVLDRDDTTCQRCGAQPGQPGVRLEVHHRTWVSHGGDNDPANLITLCSACHAGEHAVAGGTTRDELLHPGAEGDY
jgi:hypothetical protein